MDFVFWISGITILYIYIGYPILLVCLPKSKIKRNTNQKHKTVSVIISAYNEESSIWATINNKLEQNYPPELMQIIVVSDESTDKTDTIVNELAQIDSRVTLLRQSPRQGKTSAINLAISKATGEIIVFCDANGLYDNNAIQELIRYFEDPSVGYVTGKMIYMNEQGSIVGDGCSAYMKYENFLRKLETQVGSVVGVDGGIDAIRRTLYQPMAADQLPDFVLPLKVIEQGKRVVYCESAILKEESLNTIESEFQMRVRVCLRAYWAIWEMRKLFNPIKYRFFSLQFFSHKLLRYLMFVPLTLFLFSNFFLFSEHVVFIAVMILQIVFYLTSIFTLFSMENKNKIFKLLNYFILLNSASTYAFFLFLNKEKISIWNPRLG